MDRETLSARAKSETLRDAGAAVPVEEVLERFRRCRFAILAESLIADYAVMSVEALTEQFRAQSMELFAKGLKRHERRN